MIGSGCADYRPLTPDHKNGPWVYVLNGILAGMVLCHIRVLHSIYLWSWLYMILCNPRILLGISSITFCLLKFALRTEHWRFWSLYLLFVFSNYIMKPSIDLFNTKHAMCKWFGQPVKILNKYFQMEFN